MRNIVQLAMAAALTYMGISLKISNGDQWFLDVDQINNFWKMGGGVAALALSRFMPAQFVLGTLKGILNPTSDSSPKKDTPTSGKQLNLKPVHLVQGLRNLAKITLTGATGYVPYLLFQGFKNGFDTNIAQHLAISAGAIGGAIGSLLFSMNIAQRGFPPMFTTPYPKSTNTNRTASGSIARTLLETALENARNAGKDFEWNGKPTNLAIRVTYIDKNGYEAQRTVSDEALRAALGINA